MSKCYESKDTNGITSYHVIPDWVSEKIIADALKKMKYDEDFRKSVLLLLMQERSDDLPAGNFQKFLDSWLYGINVFD